MNYYKNRNDVNNYVFAELSLNRIKSDKNNASCQSSPNKIIKKNAYS